jgi:hypothetical protein
VILIIKEREERGGKNVLVKSNILVVPVTVLPGTAAAGAFVIREITAVFVAESQYAL